jgi:CRP-like cAMP-binding protein
MASKLTLGDLQVVTRIPMFRGLRPETVEHIVRSAMAMMLRPRECLIMQEDPATAFFIVIDGWIKLFRNAASGGEIVITMVKNGGSFGEYAALNGARSAVSAEAVGDARVARIPADHIARCIRQYPEIGLAMIASTSQKLQELVGQVEQLKACSGLQRVAEFVSSLATVQHGACTIKLPYDKVVIASGLGLTPEYLSRAFHRLRELGVSVNCSRVEVQDVARLRQLAGEDRAAVRGLH